MKPYYEYKNCLWIKRNAKDGRVKMFCLAGIRKGEKFIMTKEKFSQFKKLDPVNDYKKIEELMKLKGDPILRDMFSRIPRETKEL